MSSLYLRSALEPSFERAEVGFKLLGGPIAANPEIFQMDIHQSPKFGEYVRLWPGAADNEIEILGRDAWLRQVVLRVKEARRPFRQIIPKHNWPRDRAEEEARAIGARLIAVWRDGFEVERWTSERERRYLVGRDDLHLFIAEIPGGTTVKEAHRALMPWPVRAAESRSPGSTRRQGEWFFILPPAEELATVIARAGDDPRAIKENRPVGEDGERKPHRADELLRIELPRRPVARYARGWVRHADHRPIELEGWRRVELNAEPRPDRRRMRWID